MKKRNKAYKPKALRVPKLIVAHNDFEQIDRLMMMIDNGTVLDAKGDVVMYSANGELYQVAPALLAWCDYWQDLSRKRGVSFDDSALRTIVNKINHGMSIKRSLINDAKAAIEIQRKLFLYSDDRLITALAIKHQSAIIEELAA
jgi:hypothetical protein